MQSVAGVSFPSFPPPLLHVFFVCSFSPGAFVCLLCLFGKETTARQAYNLGQNFWESFFWPANSTTTAMHQQVNTLPSPLSHKVHRWKKGLGNRPTFKTTLNEGERGVKVSLREVEIYVHNSHEPLEQQFCPRLSLKNFAVLRGHALLRKVL